MEIWKDIPGYEGYYQASNKGRIKSILFQSNIHNKKYQREKIMKPKKSKDNCTRVELWKDGKHKTQLVYRLVALTFLGEPPKDKTTVNHKDGNRLNNNIENLEWCSLKENIQHGFRTGLFDKCTTKIKIEDKITGTIIIARSLKEGSKLINKNHSLPAGRFPVKANIPCANAVVFLQIQFR